MGLEDGPTLDATVEREVFGAEVFWRRVRGATGEASKPRPWRMNLCTEPAGTSGHAGDGYPCRGNCATMVPHYSTDFEQAWLLFGHLVEMSGYGDFVVDMEVDSGTTATVTFGLPDSDNSGYTGMMPSAIAHAALAWVARRRGARHGEHAPG